MILLEYCIQYEKDLKKQRLKSSSVTDQCLGNYSVIAHEEFPSYNGRMFAIALNCDCLFFYAVSAIE